MAFTYLLSNEDCDYVLSFWNEVTSLESIKYLSKKIDDHNTINFRTKAKGRYSDINNPSLNSFLLEKLKPIGIINLPEYVKIAKYSKGDYFEPHHDFNFYGSGHIYKTLVIQLSDPNSYKGGDFYVKDYPKSRFRGDYSLFLSSEIHEVKLVEEGVRFSLTIFLEESDFIQTKSLM